MVTTAHTSKRLAIVGGTIVDGIEARDRWIVVTNGRVVETGTKDSPEADEYYDCDHSVILPGFVDTHCHGAEGASYNAGNDDDVVRAAQAHMRHGTTSSLASIAATDFDTMERSARTIARVIRAGQAPNLVGIHFEGPFLSPQKPGAQTVAALRAPDEANAQRLIDAADGLAISMTIAPELPGALDLITRLASKLRIMVGHSAATAAKVTEAADSGARGVTHLFNALPAIASREAGATAAALLEPRLALELIADGRHLDSVVVQLALAAAGKDRCYFVTDASAPTGLPEGRYRFADRVVDLRDGAAYLADTATLAGSSSFMIDLFRHSLDDGIDLPQAVRLSSETAARSYGWTDRGHLRPGARADLVVLGNNHHPARVMCVGRWVTNEHA